MDVHIWGPLAAAFVFGLGFRLFVRASKAFKSKIRTYPSRWAFVKANWDVFLARSVPDGFIFAIWLFKPGLLSTGLVHVGVPATIANWLTIPPTLGTSFGFGFVVDLVLDQIQLKIASNPPSWLPDIFKGEIPSYQDAVAQVVANGK